MNKKHDGLYCRARSMVLGNKFAVAQTDFFYRLAKLVGEYFVYDGLVVETEQGANGNMLLTVSVKKARLVCQPND